MIPTDFIFLFIIRVVFFMIRVQFYWSDPDSQLIRPGLAVRVDPVRLLYLPFRKRFFLFKMVVWILIFSTVTICFALVRAWSIFFLTKLNNFINFSNRLPSWYFPKIDVGCPCRFDVEVNEPQARIQPAHFTNHCLRATSVTVSDNNCWKIQSKVTTIDLPSTSKRRCLRR